MPKLDDFIHEVEQAHSATEMEDIYQRAKEELSETEFTESFGETWAMYASNRGML